MCEVYEKKSGGLGRKCEEIMEQVREQKVDLTKEVEKYCKERNVDAK